MYGHACVFSAIAGRCGETLVLRIVVVVVVVYSFFQGLSKTFFYVFLKASAGSSLGSPSIHQTSKGLKRP